ncbi:MAG: STAS domain-containing protein [Nitrospirae bacterium]|nr:STAS domain-containing protein [Nitrospirota bacterium]
MENRLEISVRNANDVTVFDLEGDFTQMAEAAIDSKAKPLIKTGCKMVMNFSRVGYINSSGIAILIALTTMLGTAGGKLGVYGLSPHFQKIFEIVGLTQYIDIHNDEADAFKKFLP